MTTDNISHATRRCTVTRFRLARTYTQQYIIYVGMLYTITHMMHYTYMRIYNMLRVVTPFTEIILAAPHVYVVPI